MRAAVLHGPARLTVEQVPDSVVVAPTDAVVRVVAAGICGTDLRGFQGAAGPANGPRCGHEFLGVVEDIGSEVTTVARGDTVVAPFVYADGSCSACRRGLPTSCRSGGMFGVAGEGGQAEAVRVPFADATLVPLPVDASDERIPAILTLSDVMATGLHAVRSARMTPGASVAVIGDGPVGLCTVLAARMGGAGRITLLGQHERRTSIGVDFGADAVVAVRGDAAVEEVRRSSGGDGTDVVVDCVGEADSAATALGICQDGGTLSVVGGVHAGIDLLSCFLRNITVTGGLTPARTYLEELLPEVLGGRLDPGPVFDLTVDLDDLVTGYEAMAGRQASKVLVRVG